MFYFLTYEKNLTALLKTLTLCYVPAFDKTRRGNTPFCLLDSFHRASPEGAGFLIDWKEIKWKKLDTK